MTNESIEILLSDDPVSRKKTVRSLSNTGFLNVWEGAVRSGKTVYALVAFCIYVIRSPETTFLLSGRTLPTIERNCILGEYGILSLIPEAVYGKVGNSTAIRFPVKKGGDIVRKTIYVSGAADVKAFMALRGNTYAGWFADEINMHDKRFVEEAFNRTVKSSDRKHFHTLNPDNPNHWYYKEYLDRYDGMSKEERRELGGYHWWHYTPTDNPSLTPQMIRAMELQYPKGSYLYDRYILGLRCMAEGLIYPQVTDAMFRPFEDMKDTEVRYCAIDFGATHATVMLFGGTFRGNRYDWRIVDEYYDENSDKTTYDHYCGFLDMCKRLGTDPNKITIAIDPAAKVLRQEFLKHGLTVIKAKNDVKPGIEFTRDILYNGTLILCDRCVKLRSQFSTYSWDPKASERGDEKPIKQNDDAVDALRYFGFTFINPLIRTRSMKYGKSTDDTHTSA
ncbi:MAG: PBSX family phage terminase large subunit [Candidatus Methanomethylophilaceae archaeon]|nr:PBSX family phage terminase large subunit [Candidatus Methanomethylophilaceae archaeon]